MALENFKIVLFTILLMAVAISIGHFALHLY